MIKPSVDYRQFRFSRLNTPEFSHVWLLLYWPLFGLGFSYVERFYPVAHYINMHCALDDLIPFNEWFLIPYLFWFVYLIGAVAYTFFFDVPGFRRMMRFVMITYSVTLIIYFLFPPVRCSGLRSSRATTCSHALSRAFTCLIRTRTSARRCMSSARWQHFSLSGMRPSSPSAAGALHRPLRHFLSAFPPSL